MPSVLFVCTANRFRSPVAAALFKKKLDEMGASDGWRVSSVGTWAENGLPIIPSISRITQKLGIDLSTHRSVGVNKQLLAEYDLTLVMEAGQKEALVSEFPHIKHHVYLLSHVAENRSYDIPDVLDSRQEAEKIVLEINSLIQRGYDAIFALATNLSHIKYVAR